MRILLRLLLIAALPICANAQIMFGNPAGRITLVEYLDYNCPVCRAFTPIVMQLATNNRQLHIIERVVPVLSSTSGVIDSAILASYIQGQFSRVQSAVFALNLPETIPYSTLVALLRKHHINMVTLNHDMQRPIIQQQLAENRRLFKATDKHRIPVVQLYCTQTPHEVMTFVGAQSYRTLQRAIHSFTQTKGST